MDNAYDTKMQTRYYALKEVVESITAASLRLQPVAALVKAKIVDDLLNFIQIFATVETQCITQAESVSRDPALLIEIRRQPTNPISTRRAATDG